MAGNFTNEEFSRFMEVCPPSAGFFGSMGVAASLVFANLGSSYGAAKSGVGVAHLVTVSPAKRMQAIVPVIMAGILGIYGLIVALIISSTVKSNNAFEYSAFSGYLHFAAGLAAGLSSLAAGLSIGIIGDSSVRAYVKEPQMFITMILMLIFSEALGLYGLIIALMLNTTAGGAVHICK